MDLFCVILSDADTKDLHRHIPCILSQYALILDFSPSFTHVRTVSLLFNAPHHVTALFYRMTKRDENMQPVTNVTTVESWICHKNNKMKVSRPKMIHEMIYQNSYPICPILQGSVNLSLHAYSFCSACWFPIYPKPSSDHG